MKKEESKNVDGAYDAFMSFKTTKVVKKALEEYAIEDGVKPPVIIRKAIVKYLKEKGALDKDKNYL